MWSNELIKLSKSYFHIGGCNVKSETGTFGLLIADDANSIYNIKMFNSDDVLNCYSRGSVHYHKTKRRLIVK
jgi:hypothetical protein